MQPFLQNRNNFYAFKCRDTHGRGYSTCGTTVNQSLLSRTPAPGFLAADHISSIPTNIEDEEDAEPPRTAGCDRRRRRRPTPFQIASVQFTEVVQRRLDLEERRLEVDRLREENIAQNRQLQETILQDCKPSMAIPRTR
ncbi:hypothetical protein EVAR_10827_1 [Eumeta japonica]|uniref:Uncharacterized protein n=1 Tax=Eumeta variegata TaxID=151549 RepID=A0A4C1Y8H2_EUMVA|nr:hypothetical protein EVAR_10827_1 [Eumeta japonica]